MATTLTDFFEITEKTQETLTKLQPFVAKQLPAILDTFYQHLMRFPETKAIVGNHNTNHLKQAQTKHWLQALEHGLEHPQYIASANRIGMAHERLGLTPDYYLGGYALTIIHILEALVDEHCPKKRFASRIDTTHLKTEIAALVRMFMYDMAGAIMVYQNKRMETLQSILNISQNFGRDVGAQVDQSATATAEMSSTIQEISSQIHDTHQLTVHLNTYAEVVQHSMAKLSEASAQIEDMLDVIVGIAEQTNLLALNAAIESARAGEAGRGFAVVAEEVRKLATTSQTSSKEISAHVADMRTATQDSVDKVGSIAENIKRIQESTTSISSAVAEQSAATDEISRGITELAQRVSDTSRAIADQIQAAGLMQNKA